MRILSLILVIYIISAAVQPCEGMFAIVLDNGQAQAQAQVSNPETEESGGDCNECSPFCICSCCAYTSTPPSIIKEFVLIHSIELNRMASEKYISKYSKSNQASVWLPPKS